MSCTVHDVNYCGLFNVGRSLLRRRKGRRLLRRTVTCFGVFGAPAASSASASGGAASKAANGAAMTPAATRFVAREPNRERLESIFGYLSLERPETKQTALITAHSSRPETRRNEPGMVTERGLKYRGTTPPGK